MSADLLRRAAVKLREHAEAASGENWDSDGTELYAENGAVWIGDAAGGEPEDEANARYVALMHPPVALALADVLDRAADVRQHEGEGTPEGGWAACIPKWIEPSLLALASSVLREEES
jgi:hypothetical protein